MERFTISLSGELANQFDELLRRKGYRNRSEAVRDLIRSEMASESIERHEAPYCVATLSYVYSYRTRDLAERLTELQHAHHDIVQSVMRVHLDHDNCIETLILRGATEEVANFANNVIAQTEVRQGRLNTVPVDLDKSHRHDPGADRGDGHEPSKAVARQYHLHSVPRN